MQTRYILADNGVGKFRPVDHQPMQLTDGQHVKLTIEDDASLIELAARVYEGLSDKEISAIEEIASDRGDFFSGGTRL
ncbi:MAG: antitoxin family protein [Blastocatellia bacterium]